MRFNVHVFGLALLAVGLTACGGQTFTKQVTEVRVSYAQVWDDRMSGYQATLSRAGVPAKIAVNPKTKATVAPGPRDLAAVPTDQAALLGRYDTMVAFKAFRFVQPVMSVAQKWVIGQWQAHLQALSDGGADEDELSARMKAMVAGNTVPPVGDAAVDYRLGALAETRALASELEEFNSRYHTALRSDIANLPPQAPPPTASEMQAIINGAITGARLGAGVGR